MVTTKWMLKRSPQGYWTFLRLEPRLISTCFTVRRNICGIFIFFRLKWFVSCFFFLLIPHKEWLLKRAKFSYGNHKLKNYWNNNSYRSHCLTFNQCSFWSYLTAKLAPSRVLSCDFMTTPAMYRRTWSQNGKNRDSTEKASAISSVQCTCFWYNSLND